MASRPKRQRLLAALRDRAHAELEDPDASALDFVVHFVGGGGLVSELALSLAEEMGESVSRTFLSGVIHNIAPDASQQVVAARRRAAALLAEESLEIADTPHKTREDIDQAKLRIGTRHWLAERFNRDEFGANSRVAVQISIGALHLDALRQCSLADSLPASALGEAAIADAEVLEGEEGDTVLIALGSPEMAVIPAGGEIV